MVRHRSMLVVAGFAAAALLVTPVASARAVHAVAAEGDTARSDGQALTRALARELRASASERERAAKTLAQLGPRGLSGLFACCTQGIVPALEAFGGESPMEPAARLVALRAFELAPRGSVLEILREVAHSGAVEAELSTAMEILARIGQLDDLALFWQLSDAGIREERLSIALRVRLRATLDALLDRVPGAEAAAAQALPRLATCLLPQVLESLARNPQRFPIGPAAERMGRDDTLDLFLLEKIESAASARLEVVDGRVRERARRALEAADALLVAQACRAASACGDVAAVPALLRLLQREDGIVSSTALSALRSLTGQNGLTSLEQWERWRADSERWWAGEAQSLLTALRVGAPAVRVDALMKLGQGRLFRDDLVDPVAECLRSNSPGTPELACAVLGNLGSKAAAPALVAALDHPKPSVVQAAHKALVRLAGRDLGPESSAWREACAGRK